MVSKKKILIIDDEVDFCFLLKSYFAGKDVDVQIANTLKDGKEKLSTNTPDIVFLDNNLPDGLGWEIAEYIRSNFPAVEINLMSAYPVPDQGVDFNSYRLWEKPINISNLKNYKV